MYLTLRVPFGGDYTITPCLVPETYNWGSTGVLNVMVHLFDKQSSDLQQTSNIQQTSNSDEKKSNQTLEPNIIEHNTGNVIQSGVVNDNTTNRLSTNIINDSVSSDTVNEVIADDVVNATLSNVTDTNNTLFNGTNNGTINCNDTAELQSVTEETSNKLELAGIVLMGFGVPITGGGAVALLMGCLGAGTKVAVGGLFAGFLGLGLVAAAIICFKES